MFVVSALVAVVTVFLAAVPPILLPSGGRNDEDLFPAPPGYLLPWAGGEIQNITQGEETTFTHNGALAYAYDIGINYDTVVAARSGKVVMVREDSNLGGCSSIFSNSGNYVVIDHGDGTSSLYLHLAYDSASVKPGDLVRQGDPIAIAGETGVTCSDDGTGPGAHLHFQVQKTSDASYMTQSLPVAFDDIPDNNGVPVEARSYVSGNFGRGKPQKIKLTPYRVPRVFNPVAQPENHGLVEAVPAPPPVPTAEAPAPPPGDAPAPETPPIADTATVTAEPTETPEPDDTETPEPTVTPTQTPTPAPSNTPTSTPTQPAAPTQPPPPPPTEVPTQAPPPPAPPTTSLQADTPAAAEPPPPPVETATP